MRKLEDEIMMPTTLKAHLEKARRMMQEEIPNIKRQGPSWREILRDIKATKHNWKEDGF